MQAAVDMTHSAIQNLEARSDGSIAEETKDKMRTNLLTVICSNEAVRPMLSVSG